MKIGERYCSAWFAGMGILSILLVASFLPAAAATPAEGEDPGLVLEPLNTPESTPSASSDTGSTAKPKTSKSTSTKAQATKSSGTTLVGRRGKAVVVSDDGAVQEVGSGDLQLRNPKPAQTTKLEAADTTSKAQSEQGNGQAAKAGEAPAAKDATATAKQSKDDAAKKAAREAVKQKDITRLRSLEKEGAWFYTKDNKPISREELDKRIASGEVADIKTVDIHLQPWVTETPPEKAATNTKARKATPPAVK